MLQSSNCSLLACGLRPTAAQESSTPRARPPPPGASPGSLALARSRETVRRAQPLSCVRLFATPWNFLGKNTGVGRHFLLQGIFLSHGSNPGLPHLLHWQAEDKGGRKYNGEKTVSSVTSAGKAGPLHARGSSLGPQQPMQETRVQSLGQEDLLEKEMATHSSISAWRITWTEEPGGLQSMGLQRVAYD